MSRPLVSIAMPVRNCERTVAAAIRSMVDQTFEDWELLVIEDGSSDGTLAEVERLRDPRIAVVHDGQNRGLATRLNEAIGLASGTYYARMDGDDVSYPRRLELQVEYLRSHEDTDLVGGGVLVFGKDGRVLGTRVPPTRHRDICRRPYAGFAMAHPTFCGRTRWLASWRFNPVAGAICDQDLLLRSFATSRFANVGEIILGYREERVQFRKSVAYRSAFGRSLVSQRKSRGVAETAFGLALIGAKWGADAVAVATGLQHRLLRHRARPATKEEEAEWREVWKRANSVARSK